MNNTVEYSKNTLSQTNQAIDMQQIVGLQQTVLRKKSDKILVNWSMCLCWFSPVISKTARYLSLLVLYFLIGCAAVPNAPNSTTESSLSQQQQLDRAMVADLIGALPQLLEPLSTTIQFNETLSGNTGNLILQLVDLGYGLQRVDADQGKYFLRLEEITNSDDLAKQETRLRLSLGGIELTRSYRIINTANIGQSVELIQYGNQAVVPASPLLVAGTRQRVGVSGVELAASVVDLGNTPVALIPGTVQYTSNSPIDGGIPTISLITSELVQQVATSAFPGADLGQLYASSFTLENMTHVTDQAFAAVSDNYERVARETVIFPNDSQFLGRPGKLQVKKLLKRFSQNTDLVGIVGCSNGRTRLEIGNEGLALGRAKRIAEEFYTAGLSRDKVFNEGCWSTEPGAEGFPNRGVVIDLWRRKV